MRALVSEIRNHRVLFAVVIGLQAFLSMAPYIALFVYSPNLEESYIANVADYFSFSLLLFWLWFAAVGLIGAGGYWGAEAGIRFLLEGVRHGSYRRWLGRKLGTVVVISLFVYGFVPYVFLAAHYRGQDASILLASSLLALYGLHLVLALVILSMVGVSTGHAFTAVFIYHALNLFFNHLGLPNVIRYFLIAEHGTTASLGAAIAIVVVALMLLLVSSRPSSITTRGSEFI